MDISRLNRSSSAAGAGPCGGPGTLRVGTAERDWLGTDPASSAALTAAAPSSASGEDHRRSPPPPRYFRLRRHPPRRHRSRRHPRHHLRELGRARVNGAGRGRRPGAGGAPSARPPRHSPRRAPPAAARSSSTSGASSSTTRSCSSLRASRSPRSWAASSSCAAGYGTRTVRVRPSRPRSSATRSRPRLGSASAARPAITARRSRAGRAGRPAPRWHTAHGHVGRARFRFRCGAPWRLLSPVFPASLRAPRPSRPGDGGGGAGRRRAGEHRERRGGTRGIPGGGAGGERGAREGSAGRAGGQRPRALQLLTGGGGAGSLGLWAGPGFEGRGPEGVVAVRGGAAQPSPAQASSAPLVPLPSRRGRSVSPQGAVKRQALYACSTCTPPGAEPAGICLACSYECHGSHRLFELYTKRYGRGRGSGRVGASHLPWLPINCWELLRIHNPACSHLI